jgi:hypothetical protein
VAYILPLAFGLAGIAWPLSYLFLLFYAPEFVGAAADPDANPAHAF